MMINLAYSVHLLILNNQLIGGWQEALKIGFSRDQFISWDKQNLLLLFETVNKKFSSDNFYPAGGCRIDRNFKRRSVIKN